jgi:hypothetical protein
VLGIAAAATNPTLAIVALIVAYVIAGVGFYAAL